MIWHSIRFNICIFSDEYIKIIKHYHKITSFVEDYFLIIFDYIYSTLLDMIANRKSVGMWSGEILLNRNARPPNFDKLIACKLSSII
jgi:hypothetical protein